MHHASYYRRELFHTTPLFCLTAGIWALSQLAPFFWVTELLSHFGTEYLILFLLYGLRFATTKRWKLAATALLLACWPAYYIAPFYLPAASAAPADKGHHITLLQWNVYSKNNEMNRVINVLSESGADILVLQEIHPSWQRALDRLKRHYPYVAGETERYRSGLAIFSRYPVRDDHYDWFADRKRALLHAEIVYPGLPEPLIVYTAHPISPVLPERWHRRNNHLQMSADIINRDTSRYILFAADINTSPFNTHYRAFDRQIALRNAQKGLGWLNSWSPVRLANWLSSVFIDHTYVSDAITPVTRETLGFFGSDHQAILAKYRMKEH